MCAMCVWVYSIDSLLLLCGVGGGGRRRRPHHHHRQFFSLIRLLTHSPNLVAFSIRFHLYFARNIIIRRVFLAASFFVDDDVCIDSI